MRYLFPVDHLVHLRKVIAATLMQADAARIRVTNNTYTADLDGRTANFLTAQGMQVTDYGIPTGWSEQTVLIVYSPKLYALRYLTDTFGIMGVTRSSSSLTRLRQLILKFVLERIGSANYQMGIILINLG